MHIAVAIYGIAAQLTKAIQYKWVYRVSEESFHLLPYK